MRIILAVLILLAASTASFAGDDDSTGTSSGTSTGTSTGTSSGTSTATRR